MTVTFLVTILVFGLVFILMSIKVILKRDDRFTLTCSNGFGDDVDTCSLCGNRGEEYCQSGERNGNNSIGQL
jgi:hypothetical protein